MDIYELQKENERLRKESVDFAFKAAAQIEKLKKENDLLRQINKGLSASLMDAANEFERMVHSGSG